MDLRCICTKAGGIALLLAPVTLLAGSAFGQFTACTTPPPGAGSCFVQTPGVVGCTNPDCCNAVCAFDDFCCTVEWDDFCVGTAQTLCVGGLKHDTCDDALTVTAGLSIELDTTGASTDGPAHPTCQEFAAPADGIVHVDLWLRYVSTVNGSVTFTTCNTADFDTKIAVYRNAAGCSDAQLTSAFVVCDDDQTGGCAGLTSLAFAPTAVVGDVFLVRVGGFDDTEFGTFQLNVLPQAGGGLPGCGTAPNACSAEGTAPGCSDGNCCRLVCLAVDGFCCTSEWDAACVIEAGVLCGDPCSLSTAGTTAEGHACGVLGTADPNGGCNVTPAAFTPLTLGVTRSGAIAAVNSSPPPAADRDLDWYEIVLPASLDTDGSGNVLLNVTLTSEFAGFVVIENNACPAVAQSAIQFSRGCVPGSLHVPLAVPGTYRLIISSGFPGFATGALVSIFDGLPCGTNNDYTIRATVTDPVTNFCGPASTQSCSAASTTSQPGCSDAQCCGIVCGIDAFCCQAVWDQGCADESGLFCNPCQLTLTGATAQEGEPCDENNNGGCNATPPAFTPIANGAIMHGIGFTGTGTRDTDWYSFSTTAAQDVDGDGQVFVTVTLQSEFPAVSFILNSDCGALALQAPAYDSSQCTVDQTFGFVDAPASFILFVAPGTTAAGIFQGISCGGTLGNDYLATLNIVDHPPPPPNNNCASAIAIFNGNTSFTNIGATTEAATPALPPSCDKVGDMGDIGSDVWYTYTATCTGDVTISLCDDTNFDARMAVYGPGVTCAALGNPVACADDNCGTVLGGQPTVTFAATSGQVYRVRVGGFSIADDDEAVPAGIGNGVINISCTGGCPGGACPADLNGVGGVNSIDLGILLSSWSIPATVPGCGGALPCCADLNGDGVVNSLDLGTLLSSWIGLPGGDPDCP